MAKQTITLANSLTERDALGVGFSSPFGIDPVTRDVAGSSGRELVKQCIVDLLSTRVGERVMNEDFGVELPALLFENRNGLLDVIKVRAKEAIARHERRVANVNVTTSLLQETGISVAVSWTVRASGEKGNLVYPIYLDSETK
jgi:uncharacterized protein